MNDLILDACTLPEPLLRIIHSDKVMVRETGGVITMTPLDKDFDCTAEVFGMYNDGKLSVDEFLAQKHAEKELEF